MDNTNKTSLKKAIDSIIDIAASETTDKLFDEIETSISDENISFSDEHIKAMNKILAQNTLEKNKYKRINKHILLIAIIVMTLVVLSVFTVGAVRIKLLNFAIDIQENATDFKFSETESIISNDKYKVILHYIPDNFKSEKVDSTDSDYNILYKNENKYFVASKSVIPDIHSVDTENAETEYRDINGNKAFLSSKSNSKTLFWINNDIMYSIDGNIDEKTLINIAKNME